MRPSGSRSLGGGDVLHVAEHLDDPQAAVRIEVDEHRLLNHRLGGHELDAVAGRQEERLHLVLGREDGRGRRRRVQRRRPGVRRFEMRAAAIVAIAASPAARASTRARPGFD